MSAPKLPGQIDPPKIPSSMQRGSQNQQPPKSNFFFILMMTFLIVWSIQMFRSKDDAPVVPVEESAQTNSVAKPELTEADLAALPKDFVAEAEKSKNNVKPGFVSLGSLDPSSPYRMLVTLSNRGAALTRVELNENAYVDNNDHTGYLGQIIVDESLANEESRAGLPGVGAQVVGVGTPAERAGLKPGDRIVSCSTANGEETKIAEMADLRDFLLKRKPGEKIRLGVYDSERLASSENYRATSLTVANYFVNYSSKPADPFGVAETVDNPAAESEKVPAEQAKDDQNGAADGSAEAPAQTEVAKDEPKNADEAKKDAEKAESKSDEQNANAIAAELGEPKYLDVELISAPLSVLRPSGMMCDYKDYLDLGGLQGGYVDFGLNEENYLRNYDAKAPHVRKMNSEPSSFLLTLGSVDGEKIDNWAAVKNGEKGSANLSAPRTPLLDSELSGVEMRNGYWEYVAEESNESVAVFKKTLLERRLEVTKKYELVQTSDSKDSKNSEAIGKGRAYHLVLSYQVKNFDPKNSRVVSCLMDGPTGLPMEGAWFSSGRKTGPKMSSYGLRDVVVSINNGKAFNVIPCLDIAQEKSKQSDEIKLDFLGVDGQYFQCTAIPTEKSSENKFTYAPIRVGTRFADHMNFTDVSYRLKSSERKLAPYGQDGDSCSEEFVVFVGPKQRDITADYGLSKTIVYGWFWFVSIPLVAILHFFHDYVVFNYGLAIMLLTILVRLCLFPLSRKQVLSSMRMQKLQPEIAKLKEKFKDKPQEMMVAQQTLFKKYGVNPLSGCLPIFIQMPIFIGLYRALSTDVSLYGAPLFSKGIRWCSNLAAPDMAFDWSSFWSSIGWNGFNMGGRGFLSMFCLGPYLNILPVLTIALFLIQQKLLVPPVVGDDDQARQQRSMRKMMNFMMIFMGLMFFKVPSGLCIYFIVSSLWGLLERKMLPKKQLELVPVTDDSEPVSATASMSGFASSKDKRKQGNSARGYEVYELKRDKRGRRIKTDKSANQKSGLRAWWDEVVERAKEQQRLAKAEEEDRSWWSKDDKNKKRRR